MAAPWRICSLPPHGNGNAGFSWQQLFVSRNAGVAHRL